jgi:tRNA U54 and U55 pseudouridine synthase Pus10
VWFGDFRGNLMRTHRQLVLYQSILQVLQESGCPFCRFLKEYQAARLQDHPKESIHRLCNFHIWGLAAVQDAPAAAQVFIKLVNEPDSLSKAECYICREVLAEEDLRMREFVSCLSQADVSRWLRGSAVLCIPHGEKLRRQVPPELAARVDAIIQNNRRQLAQDLQQLRDEPESERAGWGALGRAAEFLVSQRGLHS